MSHLLELRNRVMMALGSVALAFFALFPFRNDLYSLVAEPLLRALPPGAKMIAITVPSPFLGPIRVVFMLAFVLAIPFVLYQLWAFVAPGLYRHERRLALPLVVSSVLLFYAGMAFAYFLVFPAAFGFFAHQVPAGVEMQPDIHAYIDFVFALFFAFGVAFEVPVAVVILALAGVVNPDVLAEKRSYVIVGAFVIAAVLTPPDVFSQFLLAVPMLLLFELGLFVARYLLRQRAARPAG